MYLWFIRYLRGFVLFCICGKNKEAVINCAAQHGIKLWNIKRTEQGITGYLYAREYRLLSRCAREVHSKVRVLKKNGVPFFVFRHRYRKGLLVGGMIAVVLLLISQNFVWKVDFQEYDGKNKEYLMSVMEENGLKVGAYIPNLDCRLLQQEVLIEVEGISWLAFNINGTQLDVEVSEKMNPPEIKETAPCNIVAKKTGQIVHTDIYSGQEVVRTKDVVYKGDLLVSGILTDPSGSVNQVHADATVIAQTVNTHTISFSLNQEEHLYNGKTGKRYQLQILELQIPLYFDFSFPYPYDKQTDYQPIIIGDTQFPFGVTTELYQFYQPEQKKYTVSEARTIIRQAFAQYEKENLSDIEVISYEDREVLENGRVSVTREYVCKENIAKKVILYDYIN